MQNFPVSLDFHLTSHGVQLSEQPSACSYPGLQPELSFCAPAENCAQRKGHEKLQHCLVAAWHSGTHTVLYKKFPPYPMERMSRSHPRDTHTWSWVEEINSNYSNWLKELCGLDFTGQGLKEWKIPLPQNHMLFYS